MRRKGCDAPMVSRLLAEERKLWYGLFVNREEVTGRFISKAYEGEVRIAHIEVHPKFRFRGSRFTVSSSVDVTLVMKGSGEILRSLLFLAGMDIDYEELFRVNLHTIFDLVKNEALRIIKTGRGMRPNKGLYALMKSGRYKDDYGKTILPFKQSWGCRYTRFLDPTASRHPLGYLSGELYDGVKRTQPGGLGTRRIDSGRYIRWLNESYMDMKSWGRFNRIYIDKLETIYGSSIRERYVEKNDFTLRTIFDKPSYIGFVHDGKEKGAGGVKPEPRPFLKLAHENASGKINKYFNSEAKRMSLDNFNSVISVMVFDYDKIDPEPREDEDISTLKVRPGYRDFRNTMLEMSELYRDRGD